MKICGASIVKITNPSKIMICSNAPEATEAAQFNNKILSAIPSFVKLGNKKHSFALATFFKVSLMLLRDGQPAIEILSILGRKLLRRLKYRQITSLFWLV